MIDRELGFLTMLCDDCGVCFPEVGQYDVDNDFREFLLDAREAGWFHEKVGEDWSHKCPDCREDE